MVADIEAFEESLLSLDRVNVKAMLMQNDKYASLFEALEMMVVPAMERIGKKWEKGEVALSQVYMSGKICEEIVDELLPITHTKRLDDPNIAILVYKDFHILGKRLVYTFLRASGYALKDYGHQDNIEKIVDNIQKDKIEILLVSVLMLNSAVHLKELISAIKAKGLATKVIVGGAPFRFDKELYKEIGADAFGVNASDVLEIIKTLKALS
ncbi:MAG: cobalamin-dependent protein [Campylobacterales bacterium]|nr:cobalamin-dependent protein [Campylobacterales bacterium]